MRIQEKDIFFSPQTLVIDMVCEFEQTEQKTFTIMYAYWVILCAEIKILLVEIIERS